MTASLIVPFTGNTYQALQTWVETMLKQVVDNPFQIQVERDWFIEHVLDAPKSLMMQEPEFVLSGTDKLHQLPKLLQLRIERQLPIQYILGQAYFYGLKFCVSQAVLIPRPETELLVEASIAEIQKNQYQHVLDLATGSGCIAVTLKSKLPLLNITASDISADALNVAKQNALLHQADIHFIESDWFDNIPAEQVFDLICCNPPYIHPNQKETLTPEVLNEPHLALFDTDPLALYQNLIAESQNYLSPKGQLLFEMEAELFQQLQPFLDVNKYQYKTIQDYAGITRHLQIFKN